MATNVHLTPELERFARDCVEGGRYNNMSEVVRSGLRLLQEAEERRRVFGEMLHEASAEADRDGAVTISSIVDEINELIGPAQS